MIAQHRGRGRLLGQASVSGNDCPLDQVGTTVLGDLVESATLEDVPALWTDVGPSCLTIDIADCCACAEMREDD